MFAASVAGGKSWLPTALTELVHWGSADSGVTQSGGLVSAVNDRGPGGRNLAAAGGLRPTFVASATAGRPALSFNGSNRLDNVAVSPTVRAAFFVVSSVGANSGTPAKIMHSGQLYLTLVGADELAIYSGTTPSQSGLVVSGASVIGYVARAMNDIDFYVGGVKATVTSGAGAFWVDQQLSIGQDASGVQGAVIGLQEWVVLNAAPSTANVAKLRGYLGSKYGLPG